MRRKGDLIYIVPAVNVPIILKRDAITLKELCKPPPGATNRLKLVGESYVHGLMNGEALSMRITQEALEEIPLLGNRS